MAGEKEMSPPKGESTLHGAALIAALVLVAAWLVLLGWMVFRTTVPDLEWTRLLVILGSLEAVAFAAAGALFGTTIQRHRVEEAKERAEKADARASQAEKSSVANAQAAANGRALATAVKARRIPQAATGVERVSAQQPEASSELLSLAERLFPDDKEGST
jgi:hypothetical protein